MLIDAWLSKNKVAPAKKTLATFGVYFFLVYAAALLLYPVIFTGEASFCIKQDNLHQTYPFFNKLAISLHKGYLPVWDANTFGGKNFAGEIQTGIFYPLNILWCLLFGSVRGIDIYYIDLLTAFHFLICFIGMYRVARQFQLSAVAGIASAMVFTFTSAVAARAGGQTCIFFGLTLLTWSVYFTCKYYLVRPHKKYLIYAGLAAGLEILAGHMQPFFHTMLINGIVIIFYENRQRKDWKGFLLPTAVNIFILLLFAMIITLPQLYYASEYMSRCYRTVSGGVFIAPGQKVPLDIYAHWFIIQLSNLPNLLGQAYAQPDDDNIIYMGVLPLFLVIAYLAGYKALRTAAVHSALTKLLLVILAIGALSVLGYLTFFYLILYEIPFVNLIRQLGRYIILISFSASLLTGLAITYISELKEWLLQNSSKIKSYILSALVLNTLYWVVFPPKDIPYSVSIPFLLSFLFFLTLLLVKRPLYAPVLAILVIGVDLMLNPVSYLPARTGFYPAYFYGRNRIIDSLETTYGKYRVTFDMDNYALVRRNLGDIYNIQTKLGYGATINMAYSNFINTDQSLNSGVNDLLNVRYVIADRRLDQGLIFKDSIQQMILYERKNWYPRCYWRRQLGMRGEEIEAENRGSIRQLAYSDLYQKIAVECTTRDTLIFSENYYPGWICTDNQQKIDIYPATIKNYPPLFRSIILDKGQHIIEFKYRKVFYWF